jgi:hypothetical protein
VNYLTSLIDFFVYGTIFKTAHPLGFEATNVTIIDYMTTNAGFLFDVDCSFDNAELRGEIIFDNIK